MEFSGKSPAVVATSFFRVSSWPRDRTRLLHYRQILYQLSHQGSLSIRSDPILSGPTYLTAFFHHSLPLCVPALLTRPLLKDIRKQTWNDCSLILLQSVFCIDILVRPNLQTSILINQGICSIWWIGLGSPKGRVWDKELDTTSLLGRWPQEAGVRNQWQWCKDGEKQTSCALPRLLLRMQQLADAKTSEMPMEHSQVYPGK